ncbi:unnamed protein product [Tenebrio molitor]|nr:unnamed protein product [Tenebrio molitor]
MVLRSTPCTVRLVMVLFGRLPYRRSHQSAAGRGYF